MLQSPHLIILPLSSTSVGHHSPPLWSEGLAQPLYMHLFHFQSSPLPCRMHGASPTPLGDCSAAGLVLHTPGVWEAKKMRQAGASRALHQHCHKWPILGGGCKPEHPFTAILISCSRGTCLIVTYVHNCYMCSKLSHMVTVVTFSQNCHILSKLSHVVTIVTHGHNCHMWSQLSPVVTIVTCDHSCHMYS